MQASETSILLEKRHSLESHEEDHTSPIRREHGNRSWRVQAQPWSRSAGIWTVVVVVMVLCLGGTHHGIYNDKSQIHMRGSPQSRSREFNDNKDPRSFDQIYHAWETFLYQQANLVSFHHPHLVVDDDDDNVDQDLIYLNHSQAFDMLKYTRPSLTNDFYYYQQGWDAQINQAYCGVASTMAAMNSLRGKIQLPTDPIYEPFPWATQLTLIEDSCVRTNIYDIDNMQNIFWGLGLEMAATLINCHLNSQGYTATPYHVDPTAMSVKDVRNTFIHALEDEDTRIIINYDRGGITQGPMGHGHFSPIGAYNEKKDAFLIMDVAKYKYPPVWVPTSKLLGGIGTMDMCAFFQYPDHPVQILYPNADFAKQIGCESMYRGYILITKNDTMP